MPTIRFLRPPQKATPACHRRGAAAVEMAIVSIVLFSVLMGGWEMSRVAMLRHSADYAAYLATRTAIIVGHQARRRHQPRRGLLGSSWYPRRRRDDQPIARARIDRPSPNDRGDPHRGQQLGDPPMVPAVARRSVRNANGAFSDDDAKVGCRSTAPTAQATGPRWQRKRGG